MKSYIRFITENKKWQYAAKFEDTQEYQDLVKKEAIKKELIEDYFDELIDELFSISPNWNYIDGEYVHSKIFFSKTYDYKENFSFDELKKFISEIDSDIKLFDDRLKIFLDGTDYEFQNVELSRYPGPKSKYVKSNVLKLLLHIKRKHNNPDVDRLYQEFSNNPTELKKFIEELRKFYIEKGMDREFFNKYLEVSPEAYDPDITHIYLTIFMPQYDEMHVVAYFDKQTNKGRIDKSNMVKRVMFDYEDYMSKGASVDS